MTVHTVLPVVGQDANATLFWVVTLLNRAMRGLKQSLVTLSCCETEIQEEERRSTGSCQSHEAGLPKVQQLDWVVTWPIHVSCMSG